MSEYFRNKLEKTIREFGGFIHDYDLYKFVDDFFISKGKYPNLYRYSPADYDNIRNLEKQRLFLSEEGKMNDVFEGLSCEINDKIIFNLKKLSDLAYIKSFSEKNKDLKMWSMYADNYEGMCVEYDINDMEKTLQYHMFPIIYPKEKILKSNLDTICSELSTIKKDLNEGNGVTEFGFLKDIMQLFLIKPKEWENEQEWRLIFSYLQLHFSYEDVEEENCESPELYRINDRTIEFPYAKKIYLGPKMPNNKKEHIYEIAKRLNLEIYDTKISKTKYELEYFLLK